MSEDKPKISSDLLQWAKNQTAKLETPLTLERLKEQLANYEGITGIKMTIDEEKKIKQPIPE